MTYSELKKLFIEHELKHPQEHLTANIVFTEDSFDESCSVENRTFVVSSNNKVFLPNMLSGYSIHSRSLDGTEPHIRLERYMREEDGGNEGWVVEDCYLIEEGVSE